jgi:hypothetical protein
MALLRARLIRVFWEKVQPLIFVWGGSVWDIVDFEKLCDAKG